MKSSFAIYLLKLKATETTTTTKLLFVQMKRDRCKTECRQLQQLKLKLMFVPDKWVVLVLIPLLLIWFFCVYLLRIKIEYVKHYPKQIKCVRVRYKQVTIEFNGSLQNAAFAFGYSCMYVWCVCVAMAVDSYSVSLVLFYWLKFTVYRTHTACAHWPCYCNRVNPRSSCTHTTWDLFLFIMIGVFFSFWFRCMNVFFFFCSLQRAFCIYI